eukprot:CAMPEP_0114495126 /NCGR_PEP_ID=MMETSP0109-20121206/5034_1 /TAXON_ID=29199 /ORGANISM="Chlorarachnion reptans, Strain CCCM449" /LENGTH=779 /DNA_ID=CAMNT_0001672239 /DNA_START=368 /DNA_END=2707 /DNA_ORIENTATION=-
MKYLVKFTKSYSKKTEIRLQDEIEDLLNSDVEEEDAITSVGWRTVFQVFLKEYDPDEPTKDITDIQECPVRLYAELVQAIRENDSEAKIARVQLMVLFLQIIPVFCLFCSATLQNGEIKGSHFLRAIFTSILIGTKLRYLRQYFCHSDIATNYQKHLYFLIVGVAKNAFDPRGHTSSLFVNVDEKNPQRLFSGPIPSLFNRIFRWGALTRARFYVRRSALNDIGLIRNVSHRTYNNVRPLEDLKSNKVERSKSKGAPSLGAISSHISLSDQCSETGHTAPNSTIVQFDHKKQQSEGWNSSNISRTQKSLFRSQPKDMKKRVHDPKKDTNLQSFTPYGQDLMQHKEDVKDEKKTAISHPLRSSRHAQPNGLNNSEFQSETAQNRPHDNGIHMLGNLEFGGRHEIRNEIHYNDKSREANDSQSVQSIARHTLRKPVECLTAKPTRLQLLKQKRMLRHSGEQLSRGTAAQSYSAVDTTSKLVYDDIDTRFIAPVRRLHTGFITPSRGSSFASEKESGNLPNQRVQKVVPASESSQYDDTVRSRVHILTPTQSVDMYQDALSIASNHATNCEYARSEMSTDIGNSSYLPDKKRNVSHLSRCEDTKHTRNHGDIVRKRIVRRRKSRYDDEDSPPQSIISNGIYNPICENEARMWMLGKTCGLLNDEVQKRQLAATLARAVRGYYKHKKEDPDAPDTTRYMGFNVFDRGSVFKWIESLNSSLQGADEETRRLMLSILLLTVPGVTSVLCECPGDEDGRGDNIPWGIFPTMGKIDSTRGSNGQHNS